MYPVYEMRNHHYQFRTNFENKNFGVMKRSTYDGFFLFSLHLCR
jgi:hypothetical protein